MKKRSQGFTVAEFVVAVVFIGVVLGPFLVFVARVHDLNNAIGQQGRREAWHSFNDQALAAGLDPTRAAALGPANNPAIPPTPALPVEQFASDIVPGRPRIVPLRAVIDPQVTEARLPGSGFQLGAGASLPPRPAPVSPLPPILMPAPSIVPADGTVVPAPSLAPGGPGLPYLLTITAQASSGSLVRASLSAPSAAAAGAGSATVVVNAADLAKGVRGSAWSEYAGRPDAGDRAISLSDGRTRWIVKTTDGRSQVYEPSAAVTFAYRLGIGAPVLRYGDTEIAPGGAAAFDYAAYLAVQSGAVAVAIEFPEELRRVFGDAWAAQPVAFQWSFAGTNGALNGDVSAFFSPEMIAAWTDRIAIAATPVVGGALVADSATWTLTRTQIPLGVPVLSTQADHGFYPAGDLQFQAPALSGGAPVGRLSFEAGRFVSTGTSLQIPITP